MKRWINSALITLLVLVLAFSLPLWAELPQNHSETQDSLFSEEIEKVTATTVALLQQRVKTAPVTKTVPPNAPTVPARQEPQEIPTPVEQEQEESQEEQAEEEAIEETLEEPMEEVTQETNQVQEHTEEQLGESPAPSQSGQAPAKPGSNHKAAEADYRQYVLQRIAAKKTYPRSARSKEQEGRVRLSITIQQDGSLGNLHVVEASPHSLLNEASLVAVQKAAPFKKMPAGMEALSLTFSMDYSLAQ